MFTGLIEEVGKFISFNHGKINISCKKILEDISIGDSICVNGICLTVTDFSKDQFKADVMPETVNRSSLANLSTNDPVNLERALQLTSRLGGHIVAGHVDGVGKILSIVEDENALIMKVSCDRNLLRQIASKGSVAIDGISLTVVESSTNFFSVSLIPTTLKQTNLHSKNVGSIVNIETDVLAKYLEKILSTDKLTHEFLIEHGF